MRRIALLLLCVSATLVAGKKKYKPSGNVKVYAAPASQGAKHVSSEPMQQVSSVCEETCENSLFMGSVNPCGIHGGKSTTIDTSQEKIELTYSKLEPMYNHVWNLDNWKQRYSDACANTLFSNMLYDQAWQFVEESFAAHPENIDIILKPEEMKSLSYDDLSQKLNQIKINVQNKYYDACKEEVHRLITQWEQERKECTDKIAELLRKKHGEDFTNFRAEYETCMRKANILAHKKKWTDVSDHICADINKKEEETARAKVVMLTMTHLYNAIEGRYPGDSSSVLRAAILNKMHIKLYEILDKPLDEIEQILLDYIDTAVVEIKREAINGRVRVLLMQGGAIAGILPLYLTKVRNEDSYIHSDNQQRLKLERHALDTLESAQNNLNAGKEITDTTVKELTDQWKVQNNSMSEKELEKLLVVDSQHNNYIIKTICPKKKLLVLQYVSKKYPLYEENTEISGLIQRMQRWVARIYPDPEDVTKYAGFFQTIENLLQNLKPNNRSSYTYLKRELEEKSNILWGIFSAHHHIKQESQVTAYELPHTVTSHLNPSTFVVDENSLEDRQNKKDKKQRQRLKKIQEQQQKNSELAMRFVENKLLPRIIKDAALLECIQQENAKVEVRDAQSESIVRDDKYSSVYQNVLWNAFLENKNVLSSVERQKIIEETHKKHTGNFNAVMAAKYPIGFTPVK